MDNEKDTFNRLADRRNLYLIYQDVNNGYDTYDSAIVAAWNEDEARNLHPDGDKKYSDYYKKDKVLSDVEEYEYEDDIYFFYMNTWAAPNDITVQLIGLAEPGIDGVIISSFNAG